jgi:hypothetical protein
MVNRAKEIRDHYYSLFNVYQDRRNPAENMLNKSWSAGMSNSHYYDQTSHQTHASISVASSNRTGLFHLYGLPTKHMLRFLWRQVTGQGFFTRTGRP